eukprot:TRINITY_DN11078_c0_g1_i1.p1 TRINITY_DN11078_c0_g1~~TRINITY_DN11078_c0_g1_i1.p1  ORF type:complete len:157 (-),score=6.85 TRINITY_DN11078_c0_g1_i1:124-594(-)
MDLTTLIATCILIILISYCSSIVIQRKNAPHQDTFCPSQTEENPPKNCSDKSWTIEHSYLQSVPVGSGQPWSDRPLSCDIAWTSVSGQPSEQGPRPLALREPVVPGQPKIRTDPGKALCQMVKFHIRFRRKLNRIRERKLKAEQEGGASGPCLSSY